MIRVFIVGDHGILRGALRALIDGQADMRVVGDAVTGHAAEECLQSAEPDVAVVDTGRTDQVSIAAVIAAARRAATRLIAISAHDDVRAAVAAGAAVYLARTAPAGELLIAIRAVWKGRNVLDAAAPQPFTCPRKELAGALSRREREVMIRVAEGYTNSQIARELNLGVKSIETYRARLMDKLGFDNRAELVRFALRTGALTASEPFS